MNKNLVIERVSSFVNENYNSTLLSPENPSGRLKIEMKLEDVPNLYSEIEDLGDPEIEYKELDGGFVRVEFTNLTLNDYDGSF